MVIPVLRKFMDEQFPDNGFPWEVLEFGISVVFLTLLFTAIFHILSGRRIAWRYVVYGSVITSIAIQRRQDRPGHVPRLQRARLRCTAPPARWLSFWFGSTTRRKFFSSEPSLCKRGGRGTSGLSSNLSMPRARDFSPSIAQLVPAVLGRPNRRFSALFGKIIRNNGRGKHFAFKLSVRALTCLSSWSWRCLKLLPNKDFCQ